MKDNFFQEILLAVIVILLAILLINPFNFWMPSSTLMLMTIVLALAFVLFAGLVWKESPSDERESLHSLVADRAAFLTGTGLLALGVIVQSFNHAIDPWLAGVLAVIVAAKIIGRIYAKIRN